MASDFMTSDGNYRINYDDMEINGKNTQLEKQIKKLLNHRSINYDGIFKALKFTIGENVTIAYIGNSANKCLQYVNSLRYHKFNNYVLTLDDPIYPTTAKFKRSPTGGTFICKDLKTICKIDIALAISNNPDSSINYVLNKVSDYIHTHTVINITFIGVNAKKYKARVISIYKKYSSIGVSVEEKSNTVYFYDTIRDTTRRLTFRSFDSVIFSQKELLINELDKFFASKNLYKKFNITYQFGILLYGSPGCGKTSIIRAICSYIFKRYNGGTCRWFNLAACRTVTNVENMIDEFIRSALDTSDQIIGKSIMNIVVIEELDQICDGTRDANSNVNTVAKAKLNTLLQFLDGINSCDDTLIIATTNYINKLDSALTRDSRFSCKIPVNQFDKEHAAQLCDYFSVGHELLDTLEYPIAPVTLQSKLFDLAYTKGAKVSE